MAETLTQTSPGTYMVRVLPIEHGVTEYGNLAKVDESDIIVDCAGMESNQAIIKYDGYKTSCRFKPKQDKQKDDVAALPCKFMSCSTDYKPERPNNTRVAIEGVNYETTFTAPRGIIYNHDGGSRLELPDGRVYDISYRTPGEYVDIRIEDNSFIRGTFLFYKY